MKRLVYPLLLFLVSCAPNEEVLRFDGLCKDLLKESLGSDLELYVQFVDPSKHIHTPDTAIIDDKVVHWMSNSMGEMPGSIELYRVKQREAWQYLVITQLASPLGGDFMIHRLDADWQVQNEILLSNKYRDASYQFYLSPGGDVLLSVASEMMKSVNPSYGIHVFEIGDAGISTCFEVATRLPRSTGCVRTMEAQFFANDQVLDSIQLERKHWCTIEYEDELWPQGNYGWLAEEHRYELVSNASYFDKLFESPAMELPVLFSLDDDTIQTDAVNMLDSLAIFLLQHSTIHLAVEVHFDLRRFDVYGGRMGQRRAERICHYLMLSGVDKERLVAKGMGNYFPLVSMEQIEKMQTEEEKEMAHAKNRRIELRVLKR